MRMRDGDEQTPRDRFQRLTLAVILFGIILSAALALVSNFT